MPEPVDNAELAACLEQLAARANATRALLPQIGEMLVAAVDDVYDASGPGWAPLKPKTIARRRKGTNKRGVSHKILIDTGIMAGTTDVATGDNWAEAFAWVSYAEFHARGQGVPKRNPFDLGPFEAPMLQEVSDLVLGSVAP